jgi:hypothetical protein
VGGGRAGGRQPIRQCGRSLVAERVVAQVQLRQAGIALQGDANDRAAGRAELVATQPQRVQSGAVADIARTHARHTQFRSREVGCALGREAAMTRHKTCRTMQGGVG